MSTKLELKNKAINLRKQGYSYGNIFKKIGVSKSTLSDWLKDVKLSKKQRNLLNLNASSGYLLGSKACREKRLFKTNLIKSNSTKEIGKIGKKEMLMLGAMLYWGEGSKQSDRNISQPVEFVNSDPKMCKFFIKWIVGPVGVDIDNLVFRIYINESKKFEANKYVSIWSKIINIPIEKIKIYFTKDRHSNLKRTNKNDYKGQLKIVVRKSTDLNRKITGWIEGICLQSGIAI